MISALRSLRQYHHQFQASQSGSHSGPLLPNVRKRGALLVCWRRYKGPAHSNRVPSVFPADDIISFLYGWRKVHCAYTPHFFHSSDDGHLGWSCNSAIMSSAEKITGRQVTLWRAGLDPPTNRTAGSYGSSIFRFWRTHYIDFSSIYVMFDGHSDWFWRQEIKNYSAMGQGGGSVGKGFCWGSLITRAQFPEFT